MGAQGGVCQYPTQLMKGRQFYKGACVSVLFFFLVAVHTIRDFGDTYIGAPPAAATSPLNKTRMYGPEAMSDPLRVHSRGLKMAGLYEEDDDEEVGLYTIMSSFTYSE